MANMKEYLYTEEAFAGDGTLPDPVARVPADGAAEVSVRPARRGAPEKVIAPKIAGGRLLYLSVRPRGQSVVVTESDPERRYEYPVENVLGLPLREYLKKFIAGASWFSPGRDPKEAARYVDRNVFPGLRWEMNDRWLTAGYGTVGWFLWERAEDGSFRYAGSLCGATERGGSVVHSHPDAMLPYVIRCHSAVLCPDRETALLIGSTMDGGEAGFWYIHAVDLTKKRLAGCFPVGRVYRLHYLRERDEFIIFRSTNEDFSFWEEEAAPWEELVERADRNGQVLQTFDFSADDGRYTYFQPKYPWTEFVEQGDRIVWCENGFLGDGGLSLLDLAEGRLVSRVFRNGTAVYYDAASGNVYAVRRLGKGCVGIYRTDTELTAPVPLFRLTGVNPKKISVVGTLSDSLICRAGSALLAIRPDGRYADLRRKGAVPAQSP